MSPLADEGRLAPHGDTDAELAMLLAGTKPAAIWFPGEGTPAQLTQLRQAGFLIVAIEDEPAPKRAPPGQTQLILGAAGRPRPYRFIAKDLRDLAHLMRAWKHGTYGDVGRALGYSDADIGAFERRGPNSPMSP